MSGSTPTASRCGGVRDEGHRGGDGRAADAGRSHAGQVEVADVAVEAAHGRDPVVGDPLLLLPRRELLGLGGVVQVRVAQLEPQVPVGGQLVQVEGDPVGEGHVVRQVVVAAGREPGTDGIGDARWWFSPMGSAVCQDDPLAFDSYARGRA